MKKIFSVIIICVFLISCNTVRKKNLVHYLPTLENIKVLSPTEEESIIIDSLTLASKKFLEKCEKNGGNCIVDNPRQDAYFKNDITAFRNIIFEQFKTNSISKEGENKILVTIGKKDSIESIIFLKYTDEDSKRQIEDIFKLKELNTWKSATTYGIPVKTQFEISIFIEKR
ncbi:hypothetical protein LNP04_09025 [Chryseobacterium sp. C-71]|uniref:hypothetical protein n=1 Tax=Chryseobacterium sp. C-71 TaxID=2893882 RepID=UPI001E38F5C3|nr:hypothetical protein [Chryseobacterium sp. C-71]UFH33823.1 hypothetical protein LNP04_09025 [Chryseobacterium sp. C-71]